MSLKIIQYRTQEEQPFDRQLKVTQHKRSSTLELTVKYLDCIQGAPLQ